MSLFKQKDPQDDRRYQLLRDQHGRLWGATIELSTGDPTGPIDLLDENRKDERGNYMHKAIPPVMPPLKFLIVDSKRAHGTLTVNYRGWKDEVRAGWAAYNTRMRAVAQAMYKDGALRAIEEREPALFDLVGQEPQPVEPIVAAEAGDPWALGLSPERPQWADKFFAPKRQAKRVSQTGEDLSFMDVAPAEPSKDELPNTEYPQPYAPGRWVLSDGTKMQGKKVDAEAAEAALAGTQHASWGDA